MTSSRDQRGHDADVRALWFVAGGSPAEEIQGDAPRAQEVLRRSGEYCPHPLSSPLNLTLTSPGF